MDTDSKNKNLGIKSELSICYKCPLGGIKAITQLSTGKPYNDAIGINESP